jgi:hypothetical protein
MLNFINFSKLYSQRMSQGLRLDGSAVESFQSTFYVSVPQVCIWKDLEWRYTLLIIDIRAAFGRMCFSWFNVHSKPCSIQNESLAGKNTRGKRLYTSHLLIGHSQCKKQFYIKIKSISELVKKVNTLPGMNIILWSCQNR